MTLRSGLCRAAALLFALPLTCLFVVVGAGSANASTCSGYGCHGLDPYKAGCGLYTSTSASASAGGHTLATLTNWYGHCNANWSTGALTSYALSQGDSEVIIVETEDSRGNFEFMCYPGPSNTGDLIENCSNATYGGGGTAWTDMVDGTNSTTSILDVFDPAGDEIAQATTSQ